MSTTTAAAKSKKSTWSPVDAWGTPEHEAAIAKMRAGTLRMEDCPKCKAKVHTQNAHYISDKQLAALRKVWY